MIFLSLIAVLALVHWTDVASVLQRDTWFIAALKKLRALPVMSSIPLLPLVFVFIIPMLLLIIAIWTIVHFASPSFLFFLYVPVLLYSLGRGNFLAEINVYIDLAKRGDNVAAAKWVDDLCGHAAADLHVKETTQWQELHAQALKVISYRGFERTFAVLFWFVIAGAVGALLYRLSVIYREQTQEGSMEAQLANKWLWLIEFPAVRLMGATWAFVGNFDGHALNTSLLDSEHTSMQILNNQLRSALSAPTDLYPTEQPLFENASVEEMAETAEELADAQEEAEENSQEVIEDLAGITLTSQVEPAYSFALVKSSLPLYQRSLLFWIGAIAFATLFIN